LGLFDAGARPDRPATVRHRVLTVPNAVSGLRLLAVPVFVWLVLGAGRYAAAFWLLAAIAASDWVDGYLARRLDQASRVGAVIDPLIDRTLLVAVGVALLLEGLAPWPLVVLVVVRDVALMGASFALFGAVPPIKVKRTGKAATACLLTAFPLFLLAAIDWAGQAVAGGLAWGLAVAGLALYYVAGGQYAVAAWRLRRDGASAGGHGADDAGPHPAGDR
jgi:cardiolipin synthase